MKERIIKITRAKGALNGHTKNYRIFLDGVDISHFVKYGGMIIDFADNLPVVKLELIGTVKFPDDIACLLEISKDEDKVSG